MIIECPVCQGTGKVEQKVASHTVKAVENLDRVINRTKDRAKERVKESGKDRIRRVGKETLEMALDAKFGLPDGRRVSWREATKEDVSCWIDMLNKNIAGIRESVKIAERAMAEFEASGASTVGEMSLEAQSRIFGI